MRWLATLVLLAACESYALQPYTQAGYGRGSSTTHAGDLEAMSDADSWAFTVGVAYVPLARHVKVDSDSLNYAAALNRGERPIVLPKSEEAPDLGEKVLDSVSTWEPERLLFLGMIVLLLSVPGLVGLRMWLRRGKSDTPAGPP